MNHSISANRAPGSIISLPWYIVVEKKLYIRRTSKYDIIWTVIGNLRFVLPDMVMKEIVLISGAHVNIQKNTLNEDNHLICMFNSLIQLRIWIFFQLCWDISFLTGSTYFKIHLDSVRQGKLTLSYSGRRGNIKFASFLDRRVGDSCLSLLNSSLASGACNWHYVLTMKYSFIPETLSIFFPIIL